MKSEEYEQMIEILGRQRARELLVIQPRIARIHYIINERVELLERIQQATENGMVCYVSSGRDCDMTQFVHSRLIPAPSVVALSRDIDREYGWADGPIWCGVVKPSEAPEDYSRDLALEAFEDGHPHVVSTVRWENH